MCQNSPVLLHPENQAWCTPRSDDLFATMSEAGSSALGIPGDGAMSVQMARSAASCSAPFSQLARGQALAIATQAFKVALGEASFQGCSPQSKLGAAPDISTTETYPSLEMRHSPDKGAPSVWRLFDE